MRRKRKLSDEERQKISDSNRRVMAELKKNGVKLGSARPGHWEGREDKRGFKEAAKASAIARSRRARECYKAVIELIVKWQAEGVTYEIIADRLNRQGFLTMAGNPFTQPAVTSVFQLFGRKPVQFSRIRHICSQCKKLFRVPLKDLHNNLRSYVCSVCRGEEK